MIRDKPVGKDAETLYYDRTQTGRRATFDEVYHLLKAEINACQSVYIIVDAVDELSDDVGHRTRFVESLRALKGSHQAKVHLLASSRYRDSLFARSVDGGASMSLSDLSTS